MRDATALASITGRARHPIIPSPNTDEFQALVAVAIGRAGAEQALDGLGDAEAAKEPVIAMAADLMASTRVALRGPRATTGTWGGETV